MRCHHEEAHVINHGIDFEKRTVFLRCCCKLAEHVLPAAFFAATQRFAGQIFDHVSAPIDALFHLGERER